MPRWHFLNFNKIKIHPKKKNSILKMKNEKKKSQIFFVSLCTFLATLHKNTNIRLVNQPKDPVHSRHHSILKPFNAVYLSQSQLQT